MDNLLKFDFEAEKQVRVVLDEHGEPWWVAKDVAEALGYVWNGNAAIAHVPEEWRVVRSVLTTAGTKGMATLSEQGLYFFLGRSDKPKALPMQKWVAGQVLPSIRKTGSYTVPIQAQQPTLPMALPEPAKEVTVKQDAKGRFSLNDLHRAAGSLGKDENSPNHWKDNLDTQQLIRVSSTIRSNVEPIVSKRGRPSRGGGTFAVEELAISYARWLSAEFGLRVGSAMKARAGGPLVVSTARESPLANDERLQVLTEEIRERYEELQLRLQVRNEDAQERRQLLERVETLQHLNSNQHHALEVGEKRVEELVVKYMQKHMASA